jgi:hypothetical protein
MEFAKCHYLKAYFSFKLKRHGNYHIHHLESVFNPNQEINAVTILKPYISFEVGKIQALGGNNYSKNLHYSK